MMAQGDAAAFEARRDQSRTAERPDKRRTASSGHTAAARDDIHVFEVSPGHPVNLSQWGGPHYEFAFHAPTRLDDGRDHAVIIDQVRSGTHVATYLGTGRAEDSTTIFDRRNYVSITPSPEGYGSTAATASSWKECPTRSTPFTQQVAFRSTTSAAPASQ